MTGPGCEGVLDVFPSDRRAGEVDGAVPGQPVDEDSELAPGDLRPVGSVGQWLVMRALKTITSVALTAARMLWLARPRWMNWSRRR